MVERKVLYLQLQQQVRSIRQLIGEVKQINSGFIEMGKIRIKKEDFSKMDAEFEKISSTSFDDIEVEGLQWNIIPLSLISRNRFFREIQMTLNEIKADVSREGERELR